MSRINSFSPGNSGIGHLPEHAPQTEGGRNASRSSPALQRSGVFAGAPPVPPKPPGWQSQGSPRRSASLPNMAPPPVPEKPLELRQELAAQFGRPMPGNGPALNNRPPSLPPKPQTLPYPSGSTSGGHLQMPSMPEYQSMPQRPANTMSRPPQAQQRPPAYQPPPPRWERPASPASTNTYASSRPQSSFYQQSQHGSTTSVASSASSQSSYYSRLSLNQSAHSSTSSLASTTSNHSSRPTHTAPRPGKPVAQSQPQPSSSGTSGKTSMFGKLKGKLQAKLDEFNEMHGSSSGRKSRIDGYSNSSGSSEQLTGGYGDGRWDRR